jgi:hypothetical protein
MGDLGVNEKQAPVSQGATPARWSAPPQDQLKINADGSFIPEMLRGSWGFIIGDHEGEGILADAGRLHAVPDALTSEAAACGMLIKDTCFLLREHFVCSAIFSIPRSCNSVAHELAKLALCWDPGELHVWFVKTLVACDSVEPVVSIERP